MSSPTLEGDAAAPRIAGASAGLHITQPLHRLLRESPNLIATIDRGRHRTWREVSLRARRFAAMLHALGIRPGERVALLAPNGDLFVDYLFGACWAGAVIVPINTRWSAEEMGFALTDCQSRVLVADPAFVPALERIGQLAPGLEHIILAGEPVKGWSSLEKSMEQACETPEVLRQGDDLAAILYTGGTTGRPKGVMLSHRALMAYGMCLAGSGEAAPGECMLHTAPLFHMGALAGFLGSLLNGARHVFIPAFEPGNVIAAVAEHRVTDLFLLPTMLQMVLDHPTFTQHDLSSIDHVYYGGAPITSALLERALKALPNVRFVQGYGMTETSGAATLLKPADHLDPRRLSSAGRAVMAVEIKIVDREDREMSVGEAGEILVRGETVMQGYWNRPEETAAALRDGWMHTGDIGWLDDGGYVHVVDRLKDMIVSGGENVYASEVEGILSLHPSVAQCAIVGVAHDKWGEAVHAVIVLRPGVVPSEADLLAHCRTKIAGYKCPRSFSYRESLPLSPVGKVIKADLRRELNVSKT